MTFLKTVFYEKVFVHIGSFLLKFHSRFREYNYLLSTINFKAALIIAFVALTTDFIEEIILVITYLASADLF